MADGNFNHLFAIDGNFNILSASEGSFNHLSASVTDPNDQFRNALTVTTVAFGGIGIVVNIGSVGTGISVTSGPDGIGIVVNSSGPVGTGISVDSTPDGTGISVNSGPDGTGVNAAGNIGVKAVGNGDAAVIGVGAGANSYGGKFQGGSNGSPLNLSPATVASPPKNAKQGDLFVTPDGQLLFCTGVRDFDQSAIWMKVVLAPYP
jgi:hypothetical protein